MPFRFDKLTMTNLQLYNVVMIAETFLFTEIKEKYYSLVIISHHSGETPIDFRVKRLRSQIRVVNICDLMGQNQSHVAIFSYGVKYTIFRPHPVLQIDEN